MIKVLTLFFALVALRRVLARYRKGGSLTFEVVAWGGVFTALAVVVFVPHLTDRVAVFLGVSSGFSLLTFLSISGLLFVVFRMLGKQKELDRSVTRLVRAHALANPHYVSGPSGGGEDVPPVRQADDRIR